MNVADFGYDLDEVANLVWDFERNISGLCNQSGVDLAVESVSMNFRWKTVSCDVVMHYYDGEDRVERYPACTYSFECLGLKVSG